MPLQDARGRFPDRDPAREPSGTVTLCPLGPLTNIATAFRRAPDIVGRVAEIVLMGGAYFEVGNVTPAAEFNIYVDPEAAAIVFGSGVPITVMPLDVTHKVLTTRPGSTPSARSARRWARSWPAGPISSSASTWRNTAPTARRCTTLA
jgi:purine nucleosidase